MKTCRIHFYGPGHTASVTYHRVEKEFVGQHQRLKFYNEYDELTDEVWLTAEQSHVIDWNSSPDAQQPTYEPV